MSLDAHNLKIVLILTVGFTFASLLGFFSQKLKLSPILGYLLAGYLIGPYFPGFEADLETSEQLAEIGVILMLFGVGLHFKWTDLVNVKHVAIPGAIGQTLVSSIVGAILIKSLGWSLEAGIIVGLAIGVASTVVLVRVLADNHLLDTPEGHITIGWLVVEDILTVLVLILLPSLASSFGGENISMAHIAGSLSIALLKFAALVIVMFTVGKKAVAYVFTHIARTRSQELFTLTILALIFLIATGSAVIFGTSIALGAFIAGMVVGQTDVKHQASANALPLKDAFSVIFFLSVGMLFNPTAIAQQFFLFTGLLVIILLIKPLAAFLIVIALKLPARVALIISMALAQIGEFSFILSEEAMRLNILPDEGYDVIVACALVSISINPLLFKFIEPLMNLFNWKMSLEGEKKLKKMIYKGPKAIIVGFGPIGQNVVGQLDKRGIKSTIIDRNIDTVSRLISEGHEAVYGDASQVDILNSAGIHSADLLVITAPDVSTTIKIIHTARHANPLIQVLARTKYLEDQATLGELGISWVCCEKEEIKAFNHFIHHLVPDLYRAVKRKS